MKPSKFGGSLKPNAIFSKILSIGYEFETDDLTKFSLHPNDHTLINSDISLRTLEKNVKVIDHNYLQLHFSKELYKDYFYENRASDNKKNIKFQITNDMGETPFVNYIAELREKLKIPKNEMFMFQTNDGKTFDIKFTEGLDNDEDEAFSKVEYVITYYKPKQNNTNIIIDTFTDACSRIVEHLSDLTKIEGDLIMKDENNKLNPVGITDAIIGNRILYHKPDTTLYYMDTYDYYELEEPQSISNAFFVPQMTFRSYAIDCIDIIKCIVELDPSYKYGIKTQEKEQTEYDAIVVVEEVVDNLFKNYNEDETNKHKIPMDTNTFKILKCYIFFIFYKLYSFIYSHAEILIPREEDKMYFKDILSFSSRHTNLDFYKYIKILLKEKYNITNTEEINKLLIQPEVIQMFYDREYTEDEVELYYFDFDKKHNYKFNKNAYKDDLKASDKNFGNPLYSFSSYIHSLEKNKDWLKDSGIDIYSTTFPIEDNKVMVEYRMYRNTIAYHFQNNLDSNDFEHDGISIKQMHKIVENYSKDDNQKKKIKKNESNPNTKPKAKRCPNGTRKNKLTGNCETVFKNNKNKHIRFKDSDEPNPKANPKANPNPKTKGKRCPNGTRKNKLTGNCEKFTKK